MEAALSMDRTKLEGRPMFISPSVDKSTNPTQFKVEYYWHLLIVTDIYIYIIIIIIIIIYVFIYLLLTFIMFLNNQNLHFDWLILMWPVSFLFIVSHITEQENTVCL